MANVQVMGQCLMNIIVAAEANAMRQVQELIGQISTFRVNKEALNKLLGISQDTYELLRSSHLTSVPQAVVVIDDDPPVTCISFLIPLCASYFSHVTI